MVHLCAKLPTSRFHYVPILPLARCHLCSYVSHLHVPRVVIAWFTREPRYPPPYAQVAKSWCHRVPSCPSQGAILCQVAHRKEPLRAKLPTTRCHCVPSCTSQGAIVCHVAHRKVTLRSYVTHCKVPSCGMMPIARCQCMPSCPSQGAIACQVAHHKPSRAKLPIARCHFVPSCKPQASVMCHAAHCKVPLRAYVAHFKGPSCGMMPIVGAIMNKIYFVKVPSCGYVAHCVVPWEVIA